MSNATPGKDGSIRRQDDNSVRSVLLLLGKHKCVSAGVCVCMFGIVLCERTGRGRNSSKK